MAFFRPKQEVREGLPLSEAKQMKASEIRCTLGRQAVDIQYRMTPFQKCSMSATKTAIPELDCTATAGDAPLQTMSNDNNCQTLQAYSMISQDRQMMVCDDEYN